MTMNYNDAEKFQTTGGGVDITGVATATAFVGSGAQLTGIAQPTQLDITSSLFTW